MCRTASNTTVEGEGLEHTLNRFTAILYKEKKYYINVVYNSIVEYIFYIL